MPEDSKKQERAFTSDVYRRMRIEAERAVTDLLSVMRHRCDDTVDRYMRAGERQGGPCDGMALSPAELERIKEIRLSHSAAFAHALLQGAADAFDDHKMGLTLLKRLIEVELTELEQEASFARQATSAGSNAIN